MNYQLWLFIAIPLLGFLTGAVFGKAWTILLSPMAWAVFFIGYEESWWGYGFAEGWTPAFIMWSLIGAAAIGTGILIRRSIIRPRSRV